PLEAAHHPGSSSTGEPTPRTVRSPAQCASRTVAMLRRTLRAARRHRADGEGWQRGRWTGSAVDRVVHGDAAPRIQGATAPSRGSAANPNAPGPVYAPAIGLSGTISLRATRPVAR